MEDIKLHQSHGSCYKKYKITDFSKVGQVGTKLKILFQEVESRKLSEIMKEIVE